MNVFIYQNNQLTIGLIVPSLEEFDENPTKFYPQLTGDFVSSEFKYEHPIIEGNTVREKTREERILMDNELDLLLQGEYVENGEIIFVECPEGLYKPTWMVPVWIEGATLEEVQEEKRLELKKHRDEENSDPYLYPLNGQEYDADMISRGRLFHGAELGVGINNDVEWITADNQISSVSNEDLNEIISGIVVREQELFNKFTTKYNQVLAAETIDEVKEISWEQAK